MVGRTHGIHAEPTTFGAKLALWALQVRRDRERLRAGPRRRSRSASSSGAVGTYSQRRSARSSATCASTSGCSRCPRRRCCPRDRHAEVMYACASIGATIESFALEIRHLQRTEVREAEEPFREGEQKGSSAMPHKRNPIKSRAAVRARARVCAATSRPRSRTSRSGTSATSRTRRSSASSSPTRCMLAYYMLVQVTPGRSRACGCIPSACCANLDASFGLVFSQPVLLALVEAGHDARRRVPHRAAQRDAQRGRSERSFRELLAADPEVDAARSTRRALDACFDLKRALAQRRPCVRRARRPGARAAARERHRVAAPLLGQGPRALRGRSRTRC